MGRDAAELHQEYYHRRSGGTGQRTRRARMRRAPAPFRARTVRTACPACADASRAGAGPGRSKPRRNITAGHHPSPQGLRPDGPRTAEVAETYMARRGFCTESHDPPGSAVGKDSDEALHRTIQIMPFAGEFEPCNGSIRRGSARADHHVQYSSTHLCIGVLCLRVGTGLQCRCINQPTSFYCCSRLASASQGSIIGPLY